MTAVATPQILCRLLPPGETIDDDLLRAFATDVAHGALVSFHGVVRPLEQGCPIAGLTYEWHETLASRELAAVVQEVAEHTQVHRIACAHRTGFVPVGETVVAVYVSADHRGPAFEACHSVIAELKRRVPVWKTPVP